MTEVHRVLIVKNLIQQSIDFLDCDLVLLLVSQMYANVLDRDLIITMCHHATYYNLTLSKVSAATARSIMRYASRRLNQQ